VKERLLHYPHPLQDAFLYQLVQLLNAHISRT
jgi:hypothetical protein